MCGQVAVSLLKPRIDTRYPVMVSNPKMMMTMKVTTTTTMMMVNFIAHFCRLLSNSGSLDKSTQDQTDMLGTTIFFKKCKCQLKSIHILPVNQTSKSREISCEINESSSLPLF